eukprot:15002733-Alexandrium_andersonii.AAC.1
MSASLVGSEMCIRDRCSPWRCIPLRQAQICNSRPSKHTDTETLEEWGACLLYTSDAADDM